MVNTEDLEEVGIGDFGIMYNLSPLTVVKVFHTDDYSKKGIDILIKDEVEGSKRPGCLPVLKKIKIIHCGEETTVLVKRKLSRPVYEPDKDYDTFCEKYDYWDVFSRNCMKDLKGNIFIVDTQTKKALRAYQNGRLHE
jgi:hypothetical protein